MQGSIDSSKCVLQYYVARYTDKVALPTVWQCFAHALSEAEALSRDNKPKWHELRQAHFNNTSGSAEPWGGGLQPPLGGCGPLLCACKQRMLINLMRASSHCLSGQFGGPVRRQATHLVMIPLRHHATSAIALGLT